MLIVKNMCDYDLSALLMILVMFYPTAQNKEQHEMMLTIYLFESHFIVNYTETLVRKL